MGAGASSGSGELVIGDVVTVKLETHRKRVIGIVAEIDNDLCSVQVSSTEILEHIPLAELKRIANWNEIEVGDIVKVKEKGSKLYYEANVISLNDDGTYKVKFGDEDDVEDHITQDRMLKLMSGRLEQKEWMMYKDTDDDEEDYKAT